MFNRTLLRDERRAARVSPWGLLDLLCQCGGAGSGERDFSKRPRRGGGGLPAEPVTAKVSKRHFSTTQEQEESIMESQLCPGSSAPISPCGLGLDSDPSAPQAVPLGYGAASSLNPARTQMNVEQQQMPELRGGSQLVS